MDNSEIPNTLLDNGFNVTRYNNVITGTKKVTKMNKKTKKRICIHRQDIREYNFKYHHYEVLDTICTNPKSKRFQLSIYRPQYKERPLKTLFPTYRRKQYCTSCVHHETELKKLPIGQQKLMRGDKIRT